MKRLARDNILAYLDLSKVANNKVVLSYNILVKHSPANKSE